MAYSGRLLQIRLFPVKSMDGAPVDEADIGPDGLLGDRDWAVTDLDGRPLRAKDHPALATALARRSGEDVEVLLPGRAPVPAAGAGAAIAALLGAGPLHLRPQPGGARQVAAVHVVTTTDLSPSLPRADGCRVDDPRANLLIDLDAAAADLLGASLRVGGAELLLERLPKHCAGVYASVVCPGRVRTQDPVHVLPAGGHGG